MTIPSDSAIETLNNRVRLLLDQDAAIDPKLKQIEEQQQMLSLLHSKLRAQRKHLQTELTADLETISKTTSLSFAHAFHAALPREIRDLVYTHLCTTPEIINVQTYLSGEALVSARRTVFASSISKGEKSWFRPDYVGLDVAREAAEVFYKENVFRVLDVSDWGDFPTLDPLGLGIVPAEFVRRMTVTLDDNDVGVFMRGERSKWLAAPAVGEVRDEPHPFTFAAEGEVERPRERSREDIWEPLWRVRRIEGFELEVVLLPGRGRGALKDLLELVGWDIYKRFKEEGVKARILCDERFVWKEKRDVTEFFECLAEDWQKKMDAGGIRVRS